MKNLSAFWAAAAGVAVGIVLFAVRGAGTIEDSGIFQSLKLGGKTNLISDDGAALTYNGTHYQISSATLTNASTNAFTGAGLMVLETAVKTLQTNVAAANPTATVSTSAVNGTAATFMRSDASPAIPAAFIQANQTNATLASLGGMAASAALTNLNEGIGTGLTNLLAAAVQAGQTNDGTANWTGIGTTSVQTVGFVGIGEPNPLTQLVVGMNIGLSNGVDTVFGKTNGSIYLRVGQDAANNLGVGWTYNATPSSAASDIFTSGYNNPIRIDASSLLLNSGSGGSVGVGKTPGSKLDVNGVTTATGFAVGSQTGIAFTEDVLVSGGTTNRHVYVGGIVVSNIVGVYFP